ncbi:DEAD/DEAH box helicase [Seiridium cupressi]
MPTRTSGPSPHGKKKAKAEPRTLKRKRNQDDLQQLKKSVEEFEPNTAEITQFKHLPLSTPTASGLDASHFTTLTDIQAKAIGPALKGRDLLAAAKTGSGKTLAFLVPVLETLVRAQWTEHDGLGALVIAPTRELAVQIFEVLRKIGRFHSFSAGLVIGGKNLEEEAGRLSRMNLLICTPGRLLQHLDQTAGFNVDNLQILVLDEADRILDMGFQSAMNAVIDHLPKERQTMLFSATQNRKVSDLARLSLKDPEYISVHEAASSATPATLQQHYILTPLPEKLDTLYSFIKSNLKSKMIVFMSSGKQVRFAYEAFKKLSPGVPLLHLHGRQKNTARMEIVRRFASAQYSCLIATDVVARGVDFAGVDWIVQMDCPEDPETYIHRVGRTARYGKNGKAILFLDPSEEEGMMKRLEHKKVPIKKVNVREKKKISITESIQNMCFQNTDLKYLAQKAFISYTRSIGLQKDKDIFDIRALDLEGYSASLGLPEMPRVKHQKAEDIKKIKNRSRAELDLSSGSEYDSDGEKIKKHKKKDEVVTKYDKMFGRQNQDVLSAHYSNLRNDEEEDDDFFGVKRVLNNDELDSVAQDTEKPLGKVIPIHGGQELVIDSKRREKLIKSKKQMLKYKGSGTRVVFDDDGEAHQLYELQGEDDFQREGSAEAQRQKFVQAEADRVRQADVDDKQVAKERRQEKKIKRKERERLENSGVDAPGQDQPALGTSEDADKALDLLRSLPVAGESDGEDERPTKKAKKWFQNDSDDESEKKSRKGKGKGKVIEVADEPNTLEDYEALATGLLDD